MGCLRVNCYLLSFASLTRVFSPSATRPMRPGQAAWDLNITKGISCRQTQPQKFETSAADFTDVVLVSLLCFMPAASIFLARDAAVVT